MSSPVRSFWPLASAKPPFRHESAPDDGSAAALLGLRPPESGPITISVPLGRQPRRRSGLIVHRRRIDPTAWRSAPPCTSPVDTLLDLVGDCREAGDVTGLVTSLVGRGGITSSAVSAEVRARPMMRWRRLVLEVTTATADGVRSPLEHRYRRDVEIAHGLPRPARQIAHRVAGRRVVRDLEYEAWGLVVELDGRLNHADTERVMRDMARDNAATVTGRATLRYGWREVAGRPCRVARQVADVLSARGWSGAVHRCGPTCQL